MKNIALRHLATKKMKFKKMFKFVKSKFKILTSVVLLGRLNMSRGILAGEYDEGNMAEEIYIVLFC